MSLQLVLLIAIIKIIVSSSNFKYFRSRYSQTQIDILNHALKSRFHYRSVAFNVVLLRRCLDNGVYMYFSLPFRLFLASSPSLTVLIK